MVKERHIRAASQAIREIVPPEQYRRNSRVDRAIDGGGRVIDEARPFVRLQSPDGTIWRVKVDNTGALSVAEEG